MYIVLLIVFVNLALALLFHHVAETQFFGMLTATGLLALFHLSRLVRIVFRSNNTLGRIFYTLPGGLLTFFTVSSVLFTIGSSIQEMPSLESAANFGLLWSILFFLPHLHQQHATISKIYIQMTATFYVSLVLLVAGLAYVSSSYTGTTRYILVIALQLQYIMSYFVTETDYLIRLEERYQPVLDRLSITDSTTRDKIMQTAGALPFFVPLIILLVFV